MKVTMTRCGKAVRETTSRHIIEATCAIYVIEFVVDDSVAVVEIGEILVVGKGAAAVSNVGFAASLGA